MFDVTDYSQPAAEILAMAGGGDRPLPLVCPRAGGAEARRLLERPSGELFPNARHPQAAHAGLWLYCGYFDQAHALAQDLHTVEGSYWHAILHRMEPDAWNSGYWFRRTGSHPVFPAVARAAADLGYAAGSRWDPNAFIDACESARAGGSPETIQLLERVQLAEWQILFDYCARPESL